MFFSGLCIARFARKRPVLIKETGNNISTFTNPTHPHQKTPLLEALH